MPSSSKPLALSIALFAAACGPAVAPADGTGGASTGPVVSDETTAALPSSPPPPSDSSESTDGALDDGSLDDGAVDGDSGSSSAGASFLPDPDGGLGYQCDLLTQDCPPGEKCVPWANDGGTTWNAYRCSPIDADPGEPGDPCTVEVSPTSGIDDCELGTMCWNVDPRTNTGVCVALCTGDLAAPICEDPQTHCAISGVGVLALCLPTCHPFVQDCAENEGCYPNSDHWECHPSTAMGTGTYGASCEFISDCEPGLACAGAAAVPGCEGPFGCCTDVCDLQDPQCSGAAEGVQCVPWVDPTSAPPGYEDVGLCELPG